MKKPKFLKYNICFDKISDDVLLEHILEIYGVQAGITAFILKNYDNVLTQLEKEYEEKNMKLDTKKKKEIKKIVKEFNDRPDDLAKILAERYGIDYVE